MCASFYTELYNCRCVQASNCTTLRCVQAFTQICTTLGSKTNTLHNRMPSLTHQMAHWSWQKSRKPWKKWNTIRPQAYNVASGAMILGGNESVKQTDFCLVRFYKQKRFTLELKKAKMLNKILHQYMKNIFKRKKTWKRIKITGILVFPIQSVHTD